MKMTVEAPNEVHVFGKEGRNKYDASAEDCVVVLTVKEPVDGLKHLTIREGDMIRLANLSPLCTEEHRTTVKGLIKRWFEENEDSVFSKEGP